MNKYILFIFVGYLALLQYRVYINIKSSQGDTALHFVVAGGHINLIKLLLTSHFYVNAVNNDGETALN